MILRDKPDEDDEVPDDLRFQLYQWDPRLSRPKVPHLSGDAIASICGRPDTSRRIQDLMNAVAQKLKKVEEAKEKETKDGEV